jgi:tellurite resistance protein
VFKLPDKKLNELRDRLRERGQRPSMVMPVAARDLAEALEVVEEYGVMCEAMYLMMAADRRVLNVEREVMRGALAIISNERVRTSHMEAMIDASARRVAEHGEDWCVRRVIECLREDRVLAETTVVLAAVVAAADELVTPEEHALLKKLVVGLEIDEFQGERLLDEMLQEG